MKLYPPIFFIIILAGVSNKNLAQDPYFSQFYNNRVYLNPAYAGLDQDWTLSANYRKQWFGIPDGSVNTLDANLETMMVTAELQLPCIVEDDRFKFGTAVSFFRDEAGGAPLETNGFSGALSFESRLAETKNGSKEKLLTRLDLRAGVQVSGLWRRLSGGYLIYSEQLDPVVAPVALPNEIDFNNDGFANLGAGVMLRGALKHNQRPILFTIGLAGSNLTRPNQSLESRVGNDPLPRRWTAHVGFTFRLVKARNRQRAPVDIAPQFRWDSQLRGQLNSQSIGAFILSKAYYYGAFVQYNFPRFDSPTIYRNTTTLVLHFGADIRTLMDGGQTWRRKDSGVVLGFSYDINLGGLRFGDTLGALELSLRCNIERERSRKGCGGLRPSELYDGDCPVKF